MKSSCRVVDSTARFISNQPSSSPPPARRHCKQSGDQRPKPGKQRGWGFKGRGGFRQTMPDSVKPAPSPSYPHSFEWTQLSVFSNSGVQRCGWKC